MLLEQVRRYGRTTPDRPAVRMGETVLSYRELAEKAELYSREIKKRKMDQLGLISIYMSRSPEIISAMLGINQAGCAYAVVEAHGGSYESLARLRGIGTRYVISDNATVDYLNNNDFCAYALPDAEASDTTIFSPLKGDVDGCAYVIATSGTTGKQKLVHISHGNIINYVNGIEARLDLSRCDSYAHLTSFEADLGNTSIFLSLHRGSTLNIVPESVRRDPVAIWGYFIDHGVDFVKSTPSFWRAISLSPGPERYRLDHLVLGGEPLTPELAAQAFAMGQCRTLVNHYGPTETTVGVLMNVIHSPRQLLQSLPVVPIGTPIGNTQVMIRAEDGTLHERQATGELVIGGASVSSGYIGDRALTESRFFTSADTRYYRTGDQVQADHTGAITFLGRSDRQIKVSGYRIELDGVEAALRTVAGISEAIAFTDSSSGRQQLVAAISLVDPRINLARIRRLAAEKLPSYALPSRFLVIAEFPLTTNGKIDRKRLYADLLSKSSEQDARHTVQGIETPEVTTRITEIWTAFVGESSDRTDQSFFDAGGDSLSAIELLVELERGGFVTDAAAFFDDPTLDTLISLQSAADTPPNSVSRRARTDRPLSRAQSWLFDSELLDIGYYNQSIIFKLPTNLDATRFEFAVGAVVNAHPLLRTVFAPVPSQEGISWRPVERDPGEMRIFETSCISAENQAEFESEIHELSRRDNRALSVQSGPLFRARLITHPQHPPLVLFVAHHLITDLVSWRILGRDLRRAYYNPANAVLNNSIATSFWDWSRELQNQSGELFGDLSRWQNDIPVEQRQHTGLANTEASCAAFWFSVNIDVSRALSLGNLRSGANKSVEIALLAALASAYSYVDGQRTVAIDVESHGRFAATGTGREVGHIGWYTSTYPVVLTFGSETEAERLDNVAHVLQEIPNNGVSYQLFFTEQCQICFNFLGETSLLYNDLLGPSGLDHILAPARGPSNNRKHRFKVTARTLNGRVVVDVGYSNLCEDRHFAERLATRMRDALVGYSVSSADRADPAPLYHEEGSASGKLAHIPKSLLPKPAVAVSRKYQVAAVTGVTGFLGIHFLREMLEHTGTHLRVLMRGTDAKSAADRLHNSWKTYFNDDLLVQHIGRIQIHLIDLTQPLLGLSAGEFERIGGEIDTVFNFAANTQLIGSRNSLFASNTDAMTWLMQLCEIGRSTTLHHMSTLAVAGFNEQHNPLQFSEADLDIGQSFLSPYEESKFQAEKSLLDWRFASSRLFIYRTGNITGRSNDAVFQQNATDNRIVQFLAGFAAAGAAPTRLDLSLALNHVDTIATAVLELSHSSKAEPGVYHIETPHSVPMDRIFGAMRSCGIPLLPAKDFDFQKTLARPGKTRRQEKLLEFWASRADRNVTYNSERSYKILSLLGVNFHKIQDEWLVQFCGHLKTRGALPTLVN